MRRGDVLDQARALITGDRQDAYGDALEMHANIAQLWSAYLDVRITPLQVALMLDLMKTARTKGGAYHPDNFVDKAGYSALAGEIAWRTQEP